MSKNICGNSCCENCGVKNSCKGCLKQKGVLLAVIELLQAAALIKNMPEVTDLYYSIKKYTTEIMQ